MEFATCLQRYSVISADDVAIRNTGAPASIEINAIGIGQTKVCADAHTSDVHVFASGDRLSDTNHREDFGDLPSQPYRPASALSQRDVFDRHTDDSQPEKKERSLQSNLEGRAPVSTSVI